MKNFRILLVLTLMFVSTCKFLSNPEQEENDGTPIVVISVTTSVDTDSSFFKLTIQGKNMKTIGPDEYEEGDVINVEVQEGVDRRFECERYDPYENLIDSGSATIAVTTGSVTFTMAFKAAFGPPEINFPPEDRVVAAGKEVAFSIAAEGFYLTFQWLKNGKNITGTPYYQDISQTSTFNFSNPEPKIKINTSMVTGLNGEYYVIVQGNEFIWV